MSESIALRKATSTFGQESCIKRHAQHRLRTLYTLLSAIASINGLHHSDRAHTPPPGQLQPHAFQLYYLSSPLFPRLYFSCAPQPNLNFHAVTATAVPLPIYEGGRRNTMRSRLVPDYRKHTRRPILIRNLHTSVELGRYVDRVFHISNLQNCS